MIHSPNLSKKSAGDVALVVLLNVKAVATHQAFSAPTSSVPEEFRDMTGSIYKADYGPEKGASRPDRELFDLRITD